MVLVDALQPHRLGGVEMFEVFFDGGRAFVVGFVAVAAVAATDLLHRGRRSEPHHLAVLVLAYEEMMVVFWKWDTIVLEKLCASRKIAHRVGEQRAGTHKQR